MKVILDENLENVKFIEEHVEGFEAFKQKISEYPLEKVADITGVKAELIKEAAIIIGKAKSMMTFYSMGITQHSTGVIMFSPLQTLPTNREHRKKPGVGITALRGQVKRAGSL